MLHIVFALCHFLLHN